MNKLVLTGAAGRLGSYLREPLTALCNELVSSDLADDLGKLYPGESYQKADLANYDEIHALLKGCLLYTSPSPRDGLLSRMPSSA